MGFDRVDTANIVDGAVTLAKVAEQAAARYRISLMNDCRCVNGEVLTATGTTGQFVLNATTWPGGAFTLLTELTMDNTKQGTLRFDFRLPQDYVAGAAVTIVIRARCWNICGGTSGIKTLDLVCFEFTNEGAVGNDLCTTTIQTYTESFADYTFDITSDGLAPGDNIGVAVQMYSQETENKGELFGHIGSIEVRA